MRTPGAALAAFAFLLAWVPSAAADHGCEVACLGSVQHMEGEGDCWGDSEDYYLVFGVVGKGVMWYATRIGAGYECEDQGDVETWRTGVFVEISDERGDPITADEADGVAFFVGGQQEGSKCTIVAGVLSASWDGNPELDCSRG